MPHLLNLKEVFQLLLTSRHKRGAIDFESAETEMRFTDDGKISEIVPSKRNEAHKLIEECMLAANVSTANFLIEHEHAALYRVHEGPNEDKLAQHDSINSTYSVKNKKRIVIHLKMCFDAFRFSGSLVFLIG